MISRRTPAGMKRRSFGNLAALASIAGSGLWIGSGVVRFAPGWPTPLPANVASWLAALLLAVALLCWVLPLGRLQRHATDGAPRLGRGGLALAGAGLGLALASGGHELLALFGRASWLPSALLGSGVLLLDLGLLVMGSALMQRPRPHSWQSLPLMMGLLGLFLPIGAGVQGTPGLAVWIVFGLGWAWLGLVLWLDDAAPVQARSVPVPHDRR